MKKTSIYLFNCLFYWRNCWVWKCIRFSRTWWEL